MDDIKYFSIYLDNSCEVHFNSPDNSKMFLSPCGSEFVYRTYDPSTGIIQSTSIHSIFEYFVYQILNKKNLSDSFKYRTAYPISAYFQRLSRVLSIRNRLCDDRPFVSPILEEHLGTHQNWVGFFVSNFQI